MDSAYQPGLDRKSGMHVLICCASVILLTRWKLASTRL
jgi:hypothetical protein